MPAVIGDVLPLALGVAVSPIPIVAAILLLLAPRARATSIAFLAGWTLGIVVVVTGATLLASLLPDEHPFGPQPVIGVVKLLLGALLLVLAVRQWRSRASTADRPGMPAWMSAIDSMTSLRGFALGLALSAVNPKNLIMGVSAGVTIRSGALPVGSDVVVTIVFVLLAASTVAVPVIGYAVAAARLRQPLAAAKDWLVANNPIVMAVLFLVLGVALVGQGVSAFGSSQ